MPMEAYLAVSIHGTHVYITANRKDLAVPPEGIPQRGGTLTVHNRQFRVVQRKDYGSLPVLKLHAPELEGNGRANNGEAAAISDPRRVHDYFLALGQEGWTINDGAFVSRHNLLATTAPVEEVPVAYIPPTNDSGGYVTGRTPSRPAFEGRFNNPALGVNQLLMINALDRLLTEGTALPVAVAVLVEKASDLSGKPKSSLQQVFKSSVIQSYIVIDAADQVVEFKPDGVNQWTPPEPKLIEETQPVTPPVDEEVERRETFAVPDGHEAVRDEEGRATGETQPVTSPVEDTPTSEGDTVKGDDYGIIP